jgi:hypothetical protein
MTEYIEEREVYFIFQCLPPGERSEVLQYQALFEKLQVVTGR